MLTRTVLAWLLLTAVPAFADVLIVDATGSGDFTDLQPAVDAAADGDTILVRTGTYLGFAVSQKSLTVVAEPGAAVDVARSVRVRKLTAGQTVVVIGLRVRGKAQGPNIRPGAVLLDDQGAVRFEECVLIGVDKGPFFASNPAGVGAHLEAAQDVVFSNCTIRGGQLIGCCAPSFCSCLTCGYDQFMGPNPRGGGILATTSRLAVFDTLSFGGHGEHDVALDASSGGDAATLIDSELFVQGSLLAGGDGGDSAGISTATGGNGGAGLALSGPLGSTATLVEVTLTGGTAGEGSPGLVQCVHGCSGADLVIQAGSQSLALPGLARSLDLTATATEGTAHPLTFEGEPGDEVFLFISPTAKLEAPHPLFVGQLALGLPLLRRLKMGTIDASGQLVASVPVPAVPDGEAQNLYVQPLFVDLLGTAVLGTPRTLVVLDSNP